MFALSLALVLSVCPLPFPQEPVDAAPAWRVHLRRDGSKWGYVLYREEVLPDLAALRARMKSVAPEGSNIVVQCEADAPSPMLSDLVKTLGEESGWTLQLAAEAKNKVRLEDIGTWIETEKIVGYSGWLRARYEQIYGPDCSDAMWRDFDRALLARQAYFAVNLLVNLPRMKVGAEVETEYAVRAKDVALSNAAVQRYLEAIEQQIKAEHMNGAKILLDELGFLADRRTAAYLLQFIQRDALPFYLRSAATRALQRVRSFDEVVRTGIPQFWLMAFEETPAAVAELKQNLESLSAWWKAVAAEYPAQILP